MNTQSKEEIVRSKLGGTTASEVDKRARKWQENFWIGYCFLSLITIVLSIVTNFGISAILAWVISIFSFAAFQIGMRQAEMLGKEKQAQMDVTVNNDDLKLQPILIETINIKKPAPKAVIIDVTEKKEEVKPKTETPKKKEKKVKIQDEPSPTPEIRKPTFETCNVPALRMKSFKMFDEEFFRLVGQHLEDVCPETPNKELVIHLPIPRIITAIASGISGMGENAKELRRNVSFSFLKIRSEMEK